MLSIKSYYFAIENCLTNPSIVMFSAMAVCGMLRGFVTSCRRGDVPYFGQKCRFKAFDRFGHML